MKFLPIGIENFKEMIDKDAYYIDKTEFISNVINEKFALYTRPRRFGKTLNMSMLYYFFSIKEKNNAYLFNGLKITENKEIMKYQNQYPVIFITLKDMKATKFEEQKKQFADIVKNIILQNTELLTSQYVDEADQKILNDFRFLRAEEIQIRNSLKTISRCLEKHYGKKTILLIDEYDVPLQSAYENHYDDEMADFLRGIFSAVLKTNDSLEKGILTGCLRISKESIFTGLNNFNMYSILDYGNERSFGFTEEEVKQLLLDYELLNHFDEVKEWYDGYLFGETEIYNPWSTLQYVHRKKLNSSSRALSFWANTSGNDIIYQYIKDSDVTMKEEFEKLIQGKSIRKKIRPELTYRDMDDIDNIYSFLLLTGYLKVKDRVYDEKTKEVIEDIYDLIIPNKEVYEIYNQSFMNYFRTYTKDRKKELYHKLMDGEVHEANLILNDILKNSISYYDNYESFYHGFMVGLFTEYEVKSNKESGDGRFDVMILPRTILDTAIIVECKHSKELRDLVKDSEEGAKQIIEKRYLESEAVEIYSNAVGYGISFYKKQCCITKTQA